MNVCGFVWDVGWVSVMMDGVEVVVWMMFRDLGVGAWLMCAFERAGVEMLLIV